MLECRNFQELQPCGDGCAATMASAPIDVWGSSPCFQQRKCRWETKQAPCHDGGCRLADHSEIPRVTGWASKVGHMLRHAAKFAGHGATRMNAASKAAHPAAQRPAWTSRSMVAGASPMQGILSTKLGTVCVSLHHDVHDPMAIIFRRNGRGRTCHSDCKISIPRKHTNKNGYFGAGAPARPHFLGRLQR